MQIHKVLARTTTRFDAKTEFPGQVYQMVRKRSMPF